MHASSQLACLLVLRFECVVMCVNVCFVSVCSLQVLAVVFGCGCLCLCLFVLVVRMTVHQWSHISPFTIRVSVTSNTSDKIGSRS